MSKKKDKPKAEPELKFMECDTCRAKPGAPTLCQGCYNNRTLIGRLESRLTAARISLDLARGALACE